MQSDIISRVHQWFQTELPEVCPLNSTHIFPAIIHHLELFSVCCLVSELKSAHTSNGYTVSVEKTGTIGKL